MNFEEFQKKLTLQLQKPLPGEDAQIKMAPYSKMAKHHNLNPRLSAVLALFFPKNNSPYVLLTLRNEYNGVHSKQISFPGGKKEDFDANFMETALRETEEEVGILRNKVDIIGELTKVYIPPSRFLVHPFVGVLNENPLYIIDTKEVAEIIECSVEQLLNNTLVKEKEIFVQSTRVKIKVPYFDINGHVVWGATATILSELKEVILKM